MVTIVGDGDGVARNCKLEGVEMRRDREMSAMTGGKMMLQH